MKTLNTTRHIKRTASLFLLFSVLAFATAGTGWAQTGGSQRPPTKTEEATGCMDNAGDAFVECVDGANWFKKALCTVKYVADVVLCLPSVVL